MDPNACFARWIMALRDNDNAEARAAAADYNTWVDKGGFRAEARAWSERVFGVPVAVTVNRLGYVKAELTFYYCGDEWRAKVGAGRFESLV